MNDLSDVSTTYLLRVLVDRVIKLQSLEEKCEYWKNRAEVAEHKYTELTKPYDERTGQTRYSSPSSF